MKYKRPVGWKNESHRHYLAAKGVKTNRYRAHKYYYTPAFVGADLAPIAADGVGTAGAAVVPLIPVAVPLLLLAGGTVLAKNRYDRRKKEGKGFFAKKKFTEMNAAEQKQFFKDLEDDQKFDKMMVDRREKYPGKTSEEIDAIEATAQHERETDKFLGK